MVWLVGWLLVLCPPKASGRSIRITHRHVKNNRLAAVGFVWAFIAAGCEGPTRAHYLARRDHGDRHPAALRHLYNRMLGQLPLPANQPNLRPDQGIRCPANASLTSRRLTC